VLGYFWVAALAFGANSFALSLLNSRSKSRASSFQLKY
jgi:hypothetical protein